MEQGCNKLGHVRADALEPFHGSEVAIGGAIGPLNGIKGPKWAIGQLSYCVTVWYFGIRRCRFRMAQCVNHFVPEKQMSAIPFQFCSLLCYPFRVATAPVLESMRAREPGLQAPSNLAGSKIKITHFPPLLILSQRYPIMVKEPIM